MHDTQAFRPLAAAGYADLANESTPDMTIEVEREEDGRWLAEVMELPGVMTYGKSREEATAHAKALALRVLADRLEHGEEIPDIAPLFAEAA